MGVAAILRNNFRAWHPTSPQSAMTCTTPGFVPWIILKVFLNIDGVTTSETQRIIFKSLLTSYFVIMENRNEAE